MKPKMLFDLLALQTINKTKSNWKKKKNKSNIASKVILHRLLLKRLQFGSERCISFCLVLFWWTLKMWKHHVSKCTAFVWWDYIFPSYEIRFNTELRWELRLGAAIMVRIQSCLVNCFKNQYVGLCTAVYILCTADIENRHHFGQVWRNYVRQRTKPRKEKIETQTIGNFCRRIVSLMQLFHVFHRLGVGCSSRHLPSRENNSYSGKMAFQMRFILSIKCVELWKLWI